MSKQTTDHSIEAIAAALWWGDQLRHGAKLDNGDDSPNGGLMVAMLLLARPSVSEDQVQQFQEELASRINAQLEKSNGVTLDCDYEPDHLLAESAIAAGINPRVGVFPLKTTMYVRQARVEVKCGYGAPLNTIY